MAKTVKKSIKKQPVKKEVQKSSIYFTNPVQGPPPVMVGANIPYGLPFDPYRIFKTIVPGVTVVTNIPASTKKAYGQELNDDVLLRQIYAESAFNPNAVSKAGYKGLGQIGKSVIDEYKKATGVKNVDPFNINDNLAVQKWAMNNLYNASFINKPNQDPEIRLAKTLAAYNWGRGHLSDYLNEQKNKGVDIYNSKDWINGLPKETKDYIEKILYKSNNQFNEQFKKAIEDDKYKNIIRRFNYNPNQVVIDDDMGQWKYPGEVTRIASNNITMKGVPYPVLGVGADGEERMMYPNEEHTFNQAPVTEYPMKRRGKLKKAKDGGWLNEYGNGGKVSKEELEYLQSVAAEDFQSNPRNTEIERQKAELSKKAQMSETSLDLEKEIAKQSLLSKLRELSGKNEEEDDDYYTGSSTPKEIIKNNYIYVNPGDKVVTTSNDKPMPKIKPVNAVDDGIFLAFADAVTEYKQLYPNRPVPRISSGIRTRKEQEYLWANRANNPYPVARPGTSKHELGKALDIVFDGGNDGDYQRLAALMAPRGFKWLGNYDKVHFEVDPNYPKTDVSENGNIMITSQMPSMKLDVNRPAARSFKNGGWLTQYGSGTTNVTPRDLVSDEDEQSIRDKILARFEQVIHEKKKPYNLPKWVNKKQRDAVCIYGVCNVMKDVGLMDKAIQSNTEFAQKASSLGFGEAMYDINKLKPGDILQHKQHKNKEGNYYPSHAQVFKGINPDTGDYEFYDYYDYYNELPEIPGAYSRVSLGVKGYSKEELEGKLKRGQTHNNSDDQAQFFSINYKTPPVYYPYRTQEEYDKYLKETNQGRTTFTPTLEEDPDSKKGWHWNMGPSNAAERNKLRTDLATLFNDPKLDEELKKKLKITDQNLQDYKPLIYGLIGQESNFGVPNSFLSGAKYMVENLEHYIDPKGLANLSYGPASIKLSSISPEVRKQFDINGSDDLYDPKKMYVAALDILTKSKQYAKPYITPEAHPDLVTLNPNQTSLYWYNNPYTIINTDKEQGTTHHDPNYRISMDPGSYPAKVLQASQELKHDTVNSPEEPNTLPALSIHAPKNSSQPKQRYGGRLSKYQSSGLTNENLRADGTKKGTGYFGVLNRPDGRVSTEISMGVEFDGKEVEIPTMVPTLTKEELNYLLTTPVDKEDLFHTPMGESIANKAIEHARQRMSKGLNPFYQEGEERSGLPRHLQNPGIASVYEENNKPDWTNVASEYKRGGTTWLNEYAKGGKTFTAGGEKHRVYEKESPTGNGKGVQGHIMVTHPTKDKGKWDTIDLTKIAGAKTVAQGVSATKKWHKENPEYQIGGPFLPGMNPLMPNVLMSPKQLRNTTEVVLDAASFVPALAPYAYVAGLPLNVYDLYEDISMHKPWYHTTLDAFGLIPGMRYTKYIPPSGLKKAARVVKELKGLNNAVNVVNTVNDVTDAYDDSNLPPGTMLPQVTITPKKKDGGWLNSYK